MRSGGGTTGTVATEGARPAASRSVAAATCLAGGLTGLALLPIAFDPFHPTGGGPAWVRWLVVGIGWAFVFAGAVASRMRTERRTPALLVLTGFAWFAAFSLGSDLPALWTAASVLNVLPILLVTVLLLGFPNASVHGWPAKTVAIALGAVFLLNGASTVFYDPVAFGCSTCRADLNVVLVDSRPDWINVKSRITGTTTTIAVALLLVILVSRWWRASAPQRRVLGPLVVPAAVWALSYLAYLVFQGAIGVTIYEAPVLAYHVTLGVFGVALLLVPLCFLVGLARVGARRSRVGDLVVALSAAPAEIGLDRALATALGDPSVQVVTPASHGSGYVDADGRPVDVDTSRRAVTPLVHGTEQLGALVHDPALLDDARLIHSVSAAAALALHNARLRAELLVHLEDVRRSRTRLVETADTERRRVQRNLHDGAQHRFLSAAVLLRSIEEAGMLDTAAQQALAQVGSELEAGLHELRDLARGAYPITLAEGGLGAALRSLDLTSVVDVALELEDLPRLPDLIEVTAYFVVCEALTNVGRHAAVPRARVIVQHSGDRLTVLIRDEGRGGADPTGSGLEGLSDRVLAAGGTLEVHSPAGRGTSVLAVLPAGPVATAGHAAELPRQDVVPA